MVYLEIMQRNKSLSSQEEAKRFLEALQSIHIDESNIRGLFFLFSDDIKHSDPLKILLNRLSSIDAQVFVQALIDMTPSISIQARDWLVTFYSSVLMDNKGFEIFIQALRELKTSHKESIKEVLLNIQKTNSLSIDNDELDEILNENLATSLNLLG
jgi:hypothetical protein